jgi:hypothetical protein
MASSLAWSESHSVKQGNQKIAYGRTNVFHGVTIRRPNLWVGYRCRSVVDSPAIQASVVLGTEFVCLQHTERLSLFDCAFRPEVKQCGKKI